MANLLSFPFRISSFGQAVSVEQGTDAYYGEQIATILLTMDAERPMRPNFGMPDMPFAGFQYSAFHAQVARELPEIADLAASIVSVDETTQTVKVEFNLIREGK
jgi:hypothetical protein